jgi:hypothetical protein
VIERAPAMTLLRSRIGHLVIGTMVTVLSVVRVARAQDDAQGTIKAMTGKELRRALNERQRFLTINATAPTRDALEKRLANRIHELHDVCHLTEPQVKKLHLAGRGDIKRYTDRLDSLVKRTTENDSGADSTLGLEIQDLEKTRDRLFDDGSLFSKTVVKTLSQDQLDRIDAVDRHTTTRLYRDAVTQATRGLTGLANLSTKQTEELANLILAETRPPRRFGQSDYALVMFQASRLPESKLKPIFLEAQWKLLKQHVESWNDAEQFLRSEGFVFDDKPSSSKTQSQAAGGRIAEAQLKEGTQPP